MKRLLDAALIGNAAALGFNWVYNKPYLTELSKTQSLVFKPAEKHHYDAAKKAFYGYPHAKVGDLSFQGDITLWLYEALKQSPSFSREDYLNLVYEAIKPGGHYIGYVESYGRDLVYNRLIEALKLDLQPKSINDDQMVGFAPYIASKALGLSNEVAWDLAQAFTSHSDYPKLYDLFDHIHEGLKEHAPKDVLQHHITHVPESYQAFTKLALTEANTDEVIKTINTACHINHAVPLTFHILAHTKNYQEAIELNTQIGGASCDRGLLIGALYGTQANIPQPWSETLRRKYT